MNKRILGLDIGIASVGYALIDFNDNFENQQLSQNKIIVSGVRLFQKAEKSDGKPLGEERRIARSIRRRLHRKAERLKDIRNLFVDKKLVTPQEIDTSENNSQNIYKTQKGEKQITPWQLRAEGLDRLLTGKEFAIVLSHIAKHRGYKSTRKSELKTDDAKIGEMLTGIRNTETKLTENNYRTVGEMFYKDSDYVSNKRNKANKYTNTVSRDKLYEEVKILFETQREAKSIFASKECEEQYTNIAFEQKTSGSIDKMVGKCLFEPEEFRSPKNTYSAEIFKILQKINNSSLLDISTGEIKKFTADEIKTLFVLVHNQIKITYTTVRNTFNLPGNIIFGNGVKYGETTKNKKSAKKQEYNPENEEFISIPTYHKLKKLIISKLSEEKWNDLIKNIDNLDIVVSAIALYKDDTKITENLLKKNIAKDIIDTVLELDFKKFIHISTKALAKINKFMLNGLTYDKACQAAGYDFKKGIANSTKTNFLPIPTEDEQITNPVVKRAFAQTRKVINALIREYGSFDMINIELARDLSHSFYDRLEIKKGQEEFQKQKQEARNELAKELGIDSSSVKDSDILKYRLWKQQNGYCVYSQKLISVPQLLEEGFVDIDHIIPYSRCFDDSLNNKVICLSSENRQKSNMTPYEYLTKNNNWDNFTVFLKTLKQLKIPKINRLLKQKFDDTDSNSLKSRNLNDTRYAGIYIKDFIENHLIFSENKEIKRKVNVCSGSMTALLRHKWGFEKNRQESHLHHALDAIIVASITNGMVNLISSCAKKIELGESVKTNPNKTGILKKHKFIFPYPWENFRNDVEQSLNGIFVSKAPRHKVTGKAHKEKIYSAKYIDNGYTTVKTSIFDLSLKKLQNMHDIEHNRVIYDLLKQRLEQFNDDPQKAFAKDVSMPPCKDKTKRPPFIRSIKLRIVQPSGVSVRKGIAERGDMVRVDVFMKNNKYYLIPIYISDFKNDILPNKAISAGKDEKDWTVIDNTFEFKFSLFKDDLIGLKKKKDKTLKLGYFISLHRGTANIIISNINDEKLTKDNSFGSKTLIDFKKYTIDVLGKYFEIKKEKRLDIKIKKQ
ncbi:MAG: type II CRISPR RNA-guided endonuclease Cas9 [Bacteroidaceae bacterium]|nr:type II CRISPR RNA-guided endonuclease Cas9 [Bacteroidaceae bacterium]